MRIVKQLGILAQLGLLGFTGLVLAEVPGLDSASNTAGPEATVLIVRADRMGYCAAETPQRARTLAEQAFHAAAFQRAAECYLAAGEPAFANEAFLKAAARTSTTTSQKLGTNADEVKTQVNRLKQAWRHR